TCSAGFCQRKDPRASPCLLAHRRRKPSQLSPKAVRGAACSTGREAARIPSPSLAIPCVRPAIPRATRLLDVPSLSLPCLILLSCLSTLTEDSLGPRECGSSAELRPSSASTGCYR